MLLDGKNNIQLLSMTGISKSFSGVQVLSDAKLEVRSGEVYILADENGAGKRSLIKIFAGVHPEYTGTINVDSKQVKFASIHDAAAAEYVHHEFPEGFSVHWLRITASSDCSATGQLFYN